MANRSEAVIVGWAVLTILGAGSAHATSGDPAPIPLEVLERLIHGRGHQPPSPPETLDRHLDEVDAILDRLDEEARNLSGRDADPAPRTIRAMLLAAKLQEIRAARGEVRKEAAVIRRRLGNVGPRQVKDWDDMLTRIEQRLDGLGRALDRVEQATTHGDRRRAVTVARGELRAVLSASRARREPVVTTPQPTLTQQPLRWQAPDPGNAAAPRYMTSMPRERMPAFADGVRLAAAPPTASEAQTCGYTAADLAATLDAPNTAEIQALAQRLGYSPTRIFQHVANEIAYEPYYGSLKGAVGTLWSRAGNATDQASLLIALLRASNIPARYVKGTVESTDARVQRWVGARTYSAAAAILNAGFIPTVRLVDAAQTTIGVRFTHVWVEACIAYGNYRGAATDLTGHRWVPLDASFKDKIYQAGIATAVEFDYTGYLARRTNSLPHEKYTEQVEAYIKAQPPNFTNNTLEDVAYAGRVVPRSVDVLPASLPYRVVGFSAWDTGLTAETAGLPARHRYTWTVEIRNANDTLLAPMLSLTLAEVAQHRVTLSFKGATAADQSQIDSWRASVDINAPLPCVNVVPTVKVEGVDRVVGTTAVGLCTTNNKLVMRVSLADVTVGTPAGTINTVTFNNIQAGDYHALQAYAFHASDRLLAERGARLLASVRATPNPNTNIDETEGELLHLVGLKYMRRMSDGIQRIGELDGGSGRSGNHLGLTSSRMKVGYVLDEPFAVYRSGFLVDVPGGQISNVDIRSGAQVWKSFRLMGYTASAYESWIWQENARLDAVSTVRGIQFARETGIEVLTIDATNQATQIPKLTSNASAALNYSASQVGAIQSLIGAGFTVTAPRSLILYQNWRGAVWASEKNATPTGTLQASFTINGAFAGGYTVGDAAPVSYQAPTDSGYVFESRTPAASMAPPQVSSAISQGVSATNTTSNDPVNMVTGNMYHVERDIVIKGRGLPFVFERTYNSLAPKHGPLGFGWTHSFNHVLLFNDDNADGIVTTADTDGLTSSVSWIDGTGAERFIRVAGAAAGVPIGAVFTPPSGFHFQTARLADGTYAIREKHGLTYTFEGVAGAAGQRARLVRITDRNGNSLRLTYTGAVLTSVADDLNRSLTLTYDVSGRIIEVRDWTGRRHQYGYDTAGNLTVYRNPLAVAGTQNPVTYTYYTDASLSHFMQRYVLPRGNGMTFEYYADGRVFRHYNSLGETVTFSYNVFRREGLAVNERGLARQFLFDKFGNLVRMVEEGGGERVYTYDPARPFNRLTRRDPIGRRTSYAYDANGNVTRVTLPSGNTVESSFFNAFHQPGKIKDARGNYTVLKYDARGNLLQTIRLRAGVGATVDPATYVPSPADVRAWTISTYDAYGNVLTTKQVRDPASQVGPSLEFDYNDTVNLVQGLNAVRITRRGDKNGDGIVDATEFDQATLAYDALGRATTGLRADWYATRAVYDAVDRIIRGTDDVGQLRDYAYDPNGNLARESLTVGVTLVDQRTFAYDLSDRRVTSTDAAGHITQHQYDAAGNVVATTSPDGYTIRFDLDANNRVIAAYDEEGHTVRRALDLDGQPRTVTDPNGNTVSFEYWDVTRDGRLKTQRDAVGRATQLDYDAHGNVTRVTDNVNRTTLTTYDEQDRPVRVVGPVYADATLGSIRPVMRYTYNLLGQLVTAAAGRTDATGANAGSDVVTTQMTYLWDDFGRALREIDALGRTWRRTYDVQGNVLSVTDAKNQVTQFTWAYGRLVTTRRDHAAALTTWTRNALGQVTQMVMPGLTYTTTYDAAHRVATVTDSRGAVKLTYRWSPAGRLTSYEDNQGNRTDYGYDAVGRLSGIWSPKGDLVSFFYDAGGRLTDKWLPNGVTTQYSWNADGTLAKLVNSHRGATVVSQHDYTYDAAGNRQTHTELIAGTTTPYRYVYDALNRLTEVWNSSTATLIDSYAYDPLGNRRAKTTGAGVVTTYVYDPANQLAEIRQGTIAGPLLGGLVYDANGNVTKKCEGGTVTVSAIDCTGTTVTGLTYNVLNQLSQATKTGLSTQAYVYDDQGRRIRKTIGTAPTNFLYMGPDIASQYGSSWTSPTAVFTHGPNTDDPLIRATGTIAQYYHQDGLGSVVALTNPDGTVSASARHDAWGTKVAATGTLPVYGYTGREPDETGLIYYRARYYDPALGRFTQRDPIRFAGGDINLYAYVANNPVDRIDPWGLRNVLVPGTDISGKRDANWWQPGSPFAMAFEKFTGETSSEPFRWNGGNNVAARRSAAADLVSLVNSVPLDEKVYVFAHSHGGNVVAEASALFTRPVELVVTAGTSVRPDYIFDMSHVRQGIALSGQNDKLQAWGGNSFTLPIIGEIGLAGWDRPELGFTNKQVPGGHSAYYRDIAVTIGAIDAAIRGSSTMPAAPGAVGPYTPGGTFVGLEPALVK